jgi:hypothetical protein
MIRLRLGATAVGSAVTLRRRSGTLSHNRTMPLEAHHALHLDTVPQHMLCIQASETLHRVYISLLLVAQPSKTDDMPRSCVCSCSSNTGEERCCFVFLVFHVGIA